jgi:hypothetical protein
MASASIKPDVLVSNSCYNKVWQTDDLKNKDLFSPNSGS